MAFIHTTTLIELLQERLKSLPLVAGETAGEKLFQRVGVFGAADLAGAMKATFASEQRVAFIVPVGDNHSGARDRSLLSTQRNTSLVVLMADKSMDKATAAAVVGGPHAIGILMMKDRVIDNLADEAFELADICFAPGEGEPLMIQDEAAGAGNLGRECWAQKFTTYAGEIRQVIP